MKVSLKILNTGTILKTFTHAQMKCQALFPLTIKKNATKSVCAAVVISTSGV